MRGLFKSVVLGAAVVLAMAGVVAAAPPLLTVAEESGWKKTARYDEVRAFVDELAKRSELVHVADIGKSHEGREIPLVVIADPPVKSAEEARKSGKVVVLLFGGIHSGESDGKEALLMLARELVLEGEDGGGKARAHELLKDVIVAIAPIYNPDGNERMSPDNRPGQVGPDEMGVRANAQGLDLNRDFVKLEAPETRGLVRFINEWDPAVIVDTHTTNGSFHRYPLTYDGPKNPAGDQRALEFVRDEMLPALTERVKEKAGIDTFWYGNFRGEWEGQNNREDRHTRWEMYPDWPRYGVQYFGLRNRLGILTESYSYATYRERIEAQVAFVREIVVFAAENKAEIAKLVREADSRAARVKEVAIRTEMVAAPEKAVVLGYVEEVREEDGRRRRVSTGEEREYEVDLYTRFEAKETVSRPWAYVISAPALRLEDLQQTVIMPPHPEWITNVVHNLQRHGIEVEELREDLELPATVYTIEGVTKAMRPFEGHELVTVKVSPREETMRIAAGSYVVRTGQKLGSLAVNLLEPHAQDGLATWNFVDSELKVGGDYPIVRLEGEVPLSTVETRGLPEDREALMPITFEDVYEGGAGRRGPNLGGSPMRGVQWVDGEHYLQAKDGRLRKVHAASGRSEVFHDPAKMSAALAKLPTIGRRDADGIARRTGFTMDAARAGALFEHKGDLYYARFDGSMAARLTSDPRDERYPSFSPDGKFVAFLRDYDLWVVDVETQTERQLTTGGTELVRNGMADWVYHEEVFGRSWRVYWWSPDSSRIAYMRVDSTPVKNFTIVSDIPDPPNGQTVETVPYPKAGTPNPRATLWTVEVAGGPPREVLLDEYSEEDRLIVGVGWWPDSSAVYAYVSNRTQTWQDVLRASPSGGKPTRLFRERTGAWVAKSPAPLFQKDGSFVFSSERDGYMHLYHYGKDGKLLKRITEGEWEVRGIARTGEDESGEEQAESGGEWIYFTAMKDNPIAPNLYRVRLDGTGLLRLTELEGSHSASVSPGGKYIVDSWSTHAHPTRVVLYGVRSNAEEAEGEEGRRGQESGVRGQRAEERSQRSGVRSQERGEGREQIGDQRARAVAPSVLVGRAMGDGGAGSSASSTSPGASSSSSSSHSSTSSPRSSPHSATSALQLVRILDTNPVRDLERFERVPVRMVQITMPDGFVLEGALILPPDFDESLSYPVWFTTYAGPKAPSISDSWRMGGAWDQVMAHQGYVVFRADPRSASGKGAKSAWAAYKQLGVPELADIEHAIGWLKEHPWVDGSRIGISGHSYGGFMTAYAMTNSTLFAAGIAGAPVTDWRLYDSIYTERYMLTPQENPEGYEKTSAVLSAGKLHGRMLLLHGMMDDNVHLQNATRMVRALHHAGKQNFELMLYPEARHGLGGGPAGRHYQRLMMEFIERTVGPGTRSAPAEPESPGTAPMTEPPREGANKGRSGDAHRHPAAAHSIVGWTDMMTDELGFRLITQ